MDVPFDVTADPHRNGNLINAPKRSTMTGVGCAPSNQLRMRL